MTNFDETFKEGFRESLKLLAAATDPVRIPFDEFPPIRHGTYVQVIHRGGFFACCMSCDHQFPNRMKLEDAEADASGHGRLTHVYPRIFLERHEKDHL